MRNTLTSNQCCQNFTVQNCGKFAFSPDEIILKVASILESNFSPNNQNLFFKMTEPLNWVKKKKQKQKQKQKQNKNKNKNS